MSLAVASETKLMRRADEARADPATASPFELWQLADRESNGVQTARTTLYRHALVHAGYLRTPAGRLHRTCPLCSEPLA